ncbi:MULTISPECIES: HU family DNA-binding protein [unclassified Streptomyces]|uniref:HU family DNA-binding protein n=1 Tax=unclassified Streptomyces TaxID=2593676 RepID=UPI0035DDC259
MDKDALIEAAVRKTAEPGAGVAPEDVERVIDALFGTVEQPGVIAEGLKRGETVTVIGFGAFQLDDDSQAALRPGQALNEYVNGTVS